MSSRQRVSPPRQIERFGDSAYRVVEQLDGVHLLGRVFDQIVNTVASDAELNLSLSILPSERRFFSKA